MRIILCSVVVALSCIFFQCDCGTEPDPVEDTYWDNSPAWSTAGDRLTFTGPGLRDSIFADVLYMVDTAGKDCVPLALGGLSSSWLPGDTALVFFRTDFKLYVLSLTTMQESLLCNCVDSRFPDLDSSGRYLYYEDHGVADDWATSIYRMDLDTGDTTHIVGGSFPRISPSGDYLLFWRGDTVYRRDLNEKTDLPIHTPGFQAHCDWSPDGNEILIGSITRPNWYYKILKSDPEGRTASHFTHGRDPVYSPAGDRIAVARPSPDGKDHIWLIDRDGGNPKQITF